MTKHLLLLSVLLGMASCSQETENLCVDNGNTRVRLALQGDFAVQYEGITRATAIGESDMTDLWIYDYDAATDELLQTIHLTDGLDAPTLMLQHGQHTLSVIASRGTEATADDDGITWTKPHDTFGSIVSVEATGEDVEQSVTLDRRVARVTITIADKIPATANTLRLVFSQWAANMDATTTYAAQMGEYTYNTSLAAAVGRSGINVSAYTIVPSDEAWTTSLDIIALDAEKNVLTTVPVSNLSLLHNRTTHLTGNLFSANSALSVSLNDSWDEEISVSY